MQILQPQEIDLNIPTRPKPIDRQLEGRGNHPIAAYPARTLRTVDPAFLEQFGERIRQATGILVRYPMEQCD